VAVDGSGSTDVDGTVVDWRWEFGDGQTATGSAATHRFDVDGTYVVTLTVTDDDAATHAARLEVTVVSTPPPDDAISDAFERTVAGGWGAADAGGPWTVIAGARAHSVEAGAGRHSVAAGGAATVWLASAPAILDAEVRVDVSWSRTGAQGAVWAGVSPRAVSSASDYRLKINVGSSSRPRLDLVRRVSGAETVLASSSVPDITVAPDVAYTVVVRAVSAAGATQVSAKMYARGTAEPAWQVTAADATAVLQQPGRVLLWSYTSGAATAPVRASWDSLSARSP